MIYIVGLIAIVCRASVGTSLTVAGELRWGFPVFTFFLSLFSLLFEGFCCLSLEARVKWLTALLVQHYEAFHPDLVALNRQPIGNQRRVKH